MCLSLEYECICYLECSEINYSCGFIVLFDNQYMQTNVAQCDTKSVVGKGLHNISNYYLFEDVRAAREVQPYSIICISL